MILGLDFILENMAEVVREEIRKDFRPDSCIASTNIVIRVLKKFGIRAEPMAVQAEVFNPVMVGMLQSGVKPPENDDGTWLKQSGAWIVQLGHPDAPIEEGRKKWAGEAGHLVAVLPRYKMMVDASIDQASRPHKDILLPSCLVTSVTEEFLRGAGGFAIVVNRSVIEYTPYSAEKGYTKSPDWRIYTRIARAERAIVSHIKEASYEAVPRNE